MPKRQALVEAWYRDKLKEAVPPLLVRWQQLLGVSVQRFPSDKRPEPRFHVAYVDVLGFSRLVMGNKMPRDCHDSKRSFVLVIGRNSTMICVLRGG